MPRQQKLKVFRTPIGFHDAYVAAPSRKAALQAWGSDSDLFARGIAERVEDPELSREPLEHPGQVIRLLRGTEAEQIAALPTRNPKRQTSATAETKILKPVVKRQSKPKPRPDRSALLEAERFLADMEARHRAEEQALAQREAELTRERRELVRQQERERVKLQRAVASARSQHERAMRNWRG